MEVKKNECNNLFWFLLGIWVVYTIILGTKLVNKMGC